MYVFCSQAVKPPVSAPAAQQPENYGGHKKRLRIFFFAAGKQKIKQEMRAAAPFTFREATNFPNQGCQIFLGTTYQNRKKYTKYPHNMYTKWPQIYHMAVK
jgi:hypothetical protein